MLVIILLTAPNVLLTGENLRQDMDCITLRNCETTTRNIGKLILNDGSATTQSTGHPDTVTRVLLIRLVHPLKRTSAYVLV
jgi:hypothetical protein